MYFTTIKDFERKKTLQPMKDRSASGSFSRLWLAAKRVQGPVLGAGASAVENAAWRTLCLQGKIKGVPDTSNPATHGEVERGCFAYPEKGVMASRGLRGMNHRILDKVWRTGRIWVGGEGCMGSELYLKTHSR